MRQYGICPKCKKATKVKVGISTSTLIYFQPILDEQGNNLNPDRNRITTEYECLECGTKFSETN